MKIWLENRWDDLRMSFWFVPSLMGAGAIALSLAMVRLDQATASSNSFATLGWTFTRGPEGSRAVLATVAGSMMTIASVVFSITIVALQLASSQFGPRLLRQFMRDRGNQIAMGTFIATFTYSLLVLRTINGTAGEQFVPHIAVTVGLLLTLMSIGVLIYFIHHAAESIQAENVISAVSRDLHEAIERLYPVGLGDGEPAAGKGALPAGFAEEARAIGSPTSDYIQSIDVGRLMAIATEGDLILSIVDRPGKFVFAGGVLVAAWPGARVDDQVSRAILDTFYFGKRRTLRQDVEFAIDQLVEVAVRALSPGVNDPFTAIQCVDRLGAALCALATKPIPSAFRHDEHGRLRIVTDTSTASGVLDAAFNQIRQAARGDAAVTIRLLEAIAAVARSTRNPEFLASLLRHAEMIRSGSETGLGEPFDREEVAGRYRTALAAIEAGPKSPPPSA